MFSVHTQGLVHVFRLAHILSTHLCLGYTMSCQFYNSEIPLSKSPFDIVEAHSDRTPEHWLLVTVSHDHAVSETLGFGVRR